MKKLRESMFTSWTYTPPADPEQLLYDFYFLVGYIHPTQDDDPDVAFSKQYALDVCTTHLKKHMLSAVKWSILAEFRHVHDMSDGMYDSSIVDILSPDVRKFYSDYRKYYLQQRENERFEYLSLLDPESDKQLSPERQALVSSESAQSRQKSYKSSFVAAEEARNERKWTPYQMIEAIYDIFTAVHWSSSYGGSAWVSIIDAWLKLYKTKTVQDRIVYIDHIYDLQHNTGSVFTKVGSYYKIGGFTWLKKALDWKRDVKNVWYFYDKVSGNVRPIVAWVAKSSGQGTLEEFQAKQQDLADQMRVLQDNPKDSAEYEIDAGTLHTVLSTLSRVLTPYTRDQQRSPLKFILTVLYEDPKKLWDMVTEAKSEFPSREVYEFVSAFMSDSQLLHALQRFAELEYNKEYATYSSRRDDDFDDRREDRDEYYSTIIVKDPKKLSVPRLDLVLTIDNEAAERIENGDWYLEEDYYVRRILPGVGDAVFVIESYRGQYLVVTPRSHSVLIGPSSAFEGPA